MPSPPLPGATSRGVPTPQTVGEPTRAAGRARLTRPPLPPGEVAEVETQAALRTVLNSGRRLGGLRLQDLDLRPVADELLLRSDLAGLVVLGGTVPTDLAEHLREHGAVVFPTDPSVPVRPYRGSLYTADELYQGLEQRGYEDTPDARAYAWAKDAELRHDAYVTLLRAIHDDAMSDALAALVAARSPVGVMGGHAWARDSAEYAGAARLGHGLAQRGHLVLTGGGPGAMEAAQLGAWAEDDSELSAALERLAGVPHFADDLTGWVQAALEVTRWHDRPPRAGAERSVGIPTWYYGHEPPNVFGERIAKFFSNALREDLLLEHSIGGLIVLPGAAGTVQEIFQMATRLYYEVDQQLPPVILVDKAHWRAELPVWPLLQALARDRAMAASIHLVDDVADVLPHLAPDLRHP